MLVKSYVLPHPPIVLPEIGRGEEKKIQKTFDSFKVISTEIAEIRPETIIVISPHSPVYSDGLYIGRGECATGSMAQFGLPGLKMQIDYDSELASDIVQSSPDLPLVYEERFGNHIDHGVFVPLKFIQECYSNYKIVILGISLLNASVHYELGKRVRKSIDKLARKSVIIASGDLSHVLKEDGPYGFKAEGPIFDEKIVKILSNADFASLLRVPEMMIEAAEQCGIRSFQMMAGAWAGQEVQSKFLSYENTFGVGYTALSFSPVLIKEEENVEGETENPYIKLARETIIEYVKHGKVIKASPNLPREMLERKAATFVTLNKGGRLRGCIGTLQPFRENIAAEVIGNAISAATQDPRFPAVEEVELENLVISVDVLAKAEKIESLEELDPQIYGVIVSHGYRSGVLLPNIEGVESPEEQVNIALQKAGISWDEDFELERFKVVRHE